MRGDSECRQACDVCGGVVVMGGSAGGFKPFVTILSALSPDFPLPVLLVQHLHRNDDGLFARHLAKEVTIPVIEPCDKQPISGGHVYTAPADYHMLVERNGTIALSTEEKVHWSRPSIDVLFESAALAFGERVIAVILSGASADGAMGMGVIKAADGLTLAQDPYSAEYPLMPKSAISAGVVDEVLMVHDIGKRLVALGQEKRFHMREI